MKNRAFTLLELLVVITIIGILSSIVIVSMSGSTDSATIAKGKTYAQQVHALLGHEAVLNLNFNENATGTCSDGKDVCDVSGYNNNGTIYGASYISSPVDGYALSFDGENDYVRVLHDESFNLVDTLTIEVWASLDYSKWAYILGKGYYDAGQVSLGYHTAYPNKWFLIFGGLERPFSAVTFGKWGHIVVTYDASLASDNIKMYSNGQIMRTGNYTGDGINNSSHFDIGRAYGSARYWPGLIDDVRLYAEALPTTEIQKHYVQGLEKLLSNQAITQAEYNQRMEEFNQSLASI